MVCRENSIIIHDMGSSEGAFIMAGWLSPTWQTSGGGRIFALGGTMPAISITAFGVLSFAYPPYPPAVPPQYAGLDLRFRALPFWVYLSAVALLSAGISILINRGTG